MEFPIHGMSIRRLNRVGLRPPEPQRLAAEPQQQPEAPQSTRWRDRGSEGFGEF